MQGLPCHKNKNSFPGYLEQEVPRHLARLRSWSRFFSKSIKRPIFSCSHNGEQLGQVYWQKIYKQFIKSQAYRFWGAYNLKTCCSTNRPNRVTLHSLLDDKILCFLKNQAPVMPIAETSHLQFMHIVVTQNFIIEIITICSFYLWNFHLLSTKLKFFLKPTLTLKALHF